MLHIIRLAVASALVASWGFAQIPGTDIVPADPTTRFGASVAGAGDVDGDGFVDLVVGEPGRDLMFDVDLGRARVISGLTFTDLLVLEPPVMMSNVFFGESVAGAGDVDGDGVADLAIGGQILDDGAGGFARAYVYSGATGAPIRVLGPSPTLETIFGSRVADVADADGDGVPDILVGVPNLFAIGRAALYSGATGQVIHSYTGADGSFGRAVSGVGDVDGDGRGDFAIAAPFESLGVFSNEGRVRVYSGATGALLYMITGASPNDRVGEAVAALGDVDGNGTPDFALSLTRTGSSSPPEVRIVSGANGALLRAVTGPAGEGFGVAVSSAGDFDGDGVPDLAVGAPSASGGGMPAGRVTVFSGADGSTLLTSDGTPQSAHGAALAPLGEGGGSLCGAAFAIGAPALEFAGQPFVRVFETVPESARIGTSEDFRMLTAVAGSCDGRAVHTVAAGDGLIVRLGSPAGVFTGAQVLLLAQAFATGSPPGSPPGFLELHVDPQQPGFQVLLGGPTPGSPLPPVALPSAAMTLFFAIPALPGPLSVMLQGVAVSPLASNGFFAATHAHEIVFP